MMENESYGDVTNSPSMPYLDMLTKRFLVATDSYARGHPSLPNYLELISGKTYLPQGAGGDCAPASCGPIRGMTLVNQLDEARIPWRAFMGAMPTPCDRSNSFTHGDYVVRHDPFVYFPRIVDSHECRNVLPERTLTSALEAKRPPDLLFVSPSVCNDGGHDAPCSTRRSADHYLRQTIPSIMGTTWYRAHGTIILTWDEGRSTGGRPPDFGGHVLTLVISKAARDHGTFRGYVDTAGILRTIEQSYHLAYLGRAAAVGSGILPDVR